MKTSYLLSSVLIAAAVFFAGCGGGGGVAVDGKVVNGGSPFSKETDGDLNIMLSADGGETCTAKPEADGTFKVKAQDGGSAIKPGNYKVKVTIYPSNPAAGKTPLTKSLPEAWEVGSAPATFTLDVAKLQ